MAFIKGIEVSRRFYTEVVEPLISIRFPNLKYSAALIGPGSEVLGYDTEMSTDHDWGPRVFLFLREQDNHLIEDLSQTLLSEELDQFNGYPVDLNRTVITTLPQFIEERLAVDIRKDSQLIDWLTFPSQVLSEIVGGAVFRDDTGELAALRKQLYYYPHDVWLFLMASVWNRIGQEEHLAMRSGYVGDELGSSIIGSRLVNDIMNLCFLMERKYAPYPKWFGTAFKELQCANVLLSLLVDVQAAVSWRRREDALCKAYEFIARKHNQLGITDKIEEKTSFFFDRPFKVIQGETIARTIASNISDPAIRKLSEKRLIGGIDQITDNTDFRLINLLYIFERRYYNSLIT